MGANPGFMGAYQHVAQKRQFDEANRIAGRDAQAKQLEGAIQNPANDPFDPKLQPTVDDTADVASQKQAEIAKRQAYRQQLFQQHGALYAPHEAPTLIQRLSGLISGKVKPRSDIANSTSAAPGPAATAPGGPASANPVDPNAPPPAPVVKDVLGIPISDPDVAAAHQQPLHPFQTTPHPVIGRIQEGLDALGNHLKAFAHPVQGRPDPNATANLLAQTYAAPETIKRQDVQQAAANQQALQGLKGGNQITVAEIRQGGVRGQPGQPLSLQSATSLNENEGQQFIDRNTGRPIDFEAVAQNVPGAKLTPYYQGQRLLGYEVADQNGHIITADNMKKVVGLGGKELPGAGSLGAATVPKTTSRSSTDPFGLTTMSNSTVTPISMAGTPPSGNGPMRRGAAIKSSSLAPISSNTPIPPGSLDASGHIPAGAGNKMVVEMANQLIDGNPLTGMPARAKEMAGALARQYKPDLNVAENKINFDFANNQGTQNTLKFLNSLVGVNGKGGNLDEAVRLSDSVPRTTFPPVNSAEMKGLIAAGNTPAAVFASAITEVADQVAKILQGGGTGSSTSDKKLEQANTMFNTSFNTEQFRGVAKELKTLLANRKAGMVSGNPLLEKTNPLNGASSRPPNVPAGYVLKDGPKGYGYYKP